MKRSAAVRVGVRDLKNRLTSYLKLAKANHEVIVTERGRPIAVIHPIGSTDLVMPGVDGLQTIEEMKALGFGDVPVVMVTARSSKDDIVGGYRQGAIFYLVKPFKPSYLINAVDYLIGDLSPQEQQRLETLL
jgi:prevent-host-death family protein